MGLWDWNAKNFCGSRNLTLHVNQACFEVVSNSDVPLQLYSRNAECYKCDYFVRGSLVKPNSKTSLVLDTDFGIDFYFSDGNNKFCDMRNHFGDFGFYRLNVTNHNCTEIEIIKKPEKLIQNIGIAICLYLGLIIAFWTCRSLYRKYHIYLTSSTVSLRELEMDLGNPNNREERKNVSRQSRLSSIDAFRGLAILLMIFVNYGGGQYSVFEHTPWNGLSIADLVFAWFVWIMGASVVLSMKSNLRTATSKKKIFTHIIRRSLILIALGLMLNSGKMRGHDIRVSGVLQRLGITYFVVASIELLIAKPQRNEQFGPWYYCQDITDSWIQWLCAICFTLTHELLTFLLPVPGCPTGYLGPGGLSENSTHRNCTGGAAGYLDHLIITDNHLYQRGTFVKIYRPPVPYDPEGLLGTLTSIFCALLGVHCAQIILSYNSPYSRIRKWLIWATITGISAGFLCNWSQNDGLIPINKNLWSLSYVLACSSLAFLILALFYYLIDFTHFWSGYPLIYPGMNAITLYVGHAMLKEYFPWSWKPFTDTHLELLIMNMTGSTIWLFISYLLYKHNIFITL